MQAATYGLQVLDAAVKRVAPEAGQAAADRAAEEEEGEGSRGRQVGGTSGVVGERMADCMRVFSLDWLHGRPGAADGEPAGDRGADVPRMQRDFHARMAAWPDGSVSFSS